MYRLGIVIVMGLLLIGLVYAQTADCPTLVKVALDRVVDVCAVTSRNEVCYGNNYLTASPHNADEPFVFEQPGDLVALNSVDNIHLSAMNLEMGTWGIALMKVQANLPDTIPGQNVTMIMLGDVQVQLLDEEVTRVTMTATRGVNVRWGINTSENNVITSLTTGQTITATGRLSDGTWIRVQLDDGTTGWVSADFLSGEISALDVVSVGDFVTYSPMQAFYLRTGIGETQCNEAPSDGILVQTPVGATEINLMVDGVEIRMGSTVYIQAVPDDYMTVSVLEGQVTLTADGISQVVPAGTHARVPLGEDGFAIGAPGYPEPYTRLAVRHIPIRLLPEQIRIAPPLSEDAIQTALTGNTPDVEGTTANTTNNNSVSSSYDVPPSGIWSNTGTVMVNTCDPERLPVGGTGGGYPRFTFSEDYSSFFFDWGAGYGQYTFYRSSDTVYIANLNSWTIYTITFSSPTTYFATFRSDGGCTFYQDEYGSYVGS